jgi:hypothetical protein
MSNLSHEAMAASHFKNRIERVVANLRRMADAVEREGQRVTDGPSAYANVASSIQHTVLWGLANLHLDALTNAAANADEGRREDKQRAEAPDA